MRQIPGICHQPGEIPFELERRPVGPGIGTGHRGDPDRICRRCNQGDPIPQPASVFHMEHYHKQYVPWLKELKLDLGSGEFFVPFDETIPFKIADWAREQGYDIPEDEEAIINMFGVGWWKHAPDVATKLLEINGFTRDSSGNWLLPDGTPWKISIIAAPDEADAYRLAMGAMDQWEDFGIAVEIETLERNPFYTREHMGDYDISSTWGMAGGGNANFVRDKWPFMHNFHTQFYAPIGQASLQNHMRIRSEKLDEIIDKLSNLPPEHPDVPALEEEFFKHWVENMFGIHTVSFKKFITLMKRTGPTSSQRESPCPAQLLVHGRQIHVSVSGKKRKVTAAPESLPNAGETPSAHRDMGRRLANVTLQTLHSTQDHPVDCGHIRRDYSGFSSAQAITHGPCTDDPQQYVFIGNGQSRSY